MSGPSIWHRKPDALTLVTALLANPAVTRVALRGKGAEIVRSGRVVPDPNFLYDAEELAGAIAALLKPGELSGAFALKGSRGFAALPPLSDEPILVLQRPTPMNISPRIAEDTGLLTMRLARVVGELVSRDWG
jgi:hypothetical protein